MDASEFVDRVRSDTKTELSRLGSSKSLYAATEGEMEPEAVRAAAADEAHFAAETFEGWDDGEAGTVFEAAAEHERDHYDAIAADDHEPGAPPALVEFLREKEDGVERLGGLVGWALVADETASQCSGFFTGQADPGTASTFRGFREDYEATQEAVLDALGTVCDDESDWERAVESATGAIEAAYAAYVERLEAMGVNPKPVC
jgi:hypothetical protein